FTQAAGPAFSRRSPEGPLAPPGRRAASRADPAFPLLRRRSIEPHGRNHSNRRIRQLGKSSAESVTYGRNPAEAGVGDRRRDRPAPLSLRPRGSGLPGPYAADS